MKNQYIFFLLKHMPERSLNPGILDLCRG